MLAELIWLKIFLIYMGAGYFFAKNFMENYHGVIKALKVERSKKDLKLDNIRWLVLQVLWLVLVITKQIDVCMNELFKIEYKL